MNWLHFFIKFVNKLGLKSYTNICLFIKITYIDMFILFVLSIVVLTNLKDATNPKYYKHLQVIHFSFQDMHNVNIYINENDNCKCKIFLFVHKYA
jgi:L-cystine uptake protein TcyP (sodium:dicarboxylate symporter family)